MQSDQLCSIGADMMSATSLSLSIYNLLLYGYSSQIGKPLQFGMKLGSSCYCDELFFSMGMGFKIVWLCHIVFRKFFLTFWGAKQRLFYLFHNYNI